MHSSLHKLSSFKLGVAGSDAKRPRDSWGYVYEEPDLSGGVEGIDYIIAYRDDIKEEEHDY